MASSSSHDHPPSPSPFWVTVGFAYIYLAWGVTFLAIHDAVAGIPPFLMVGCRFFIAGTVMLAVLRLSLRANFHRGTAREWKDASIVALLLLVAGNGGQSWCQQFVPTGVTALLFSTIPLWIILFDWIRPGGVAPTRRTCLGLALGFVGVGVLVAPVGTSIVSGSLFWPEMMLLLSACTFAAGGIYSRYVRATGSPLLPMARQMIVGGAVLLAISAAQHEWRHFDPARVPLSAWLGFSYLVVFGSLLGFTTYVWLMRVSTPARVATISYVNLLVAVTLGWMLLHEPLTWRVIFGTATTVGSVILVLRKGVKRVHEIIDE